jgi:hypothetical protein
MSDIKKSFNQIALESILFKGQNDWYFCFLKSEKVAHVMCLLGEKMSENQKRGFAKAIDEATEIPSNIAFFAAGDLDIQIVLASFFSLISLVRMSATRGFLSKETALYIVAECEHMVEKLALGSKPSPFVSSQDFSVPDFLNNPQIPRPLSLEAIPESLPRETPSYSRKKEEQRPVSSGNPFTPREITDRSGKILNFVLQNKAVSIKEICLTLPELSEKTIQRELVSLIGRGLIKKEGERRWSIYKPA